MRWEYPPEGLGAGERIPSTSRNFLDLSLA